MKPLRFQRFSVSAFQLLLAVLLLCASPSYAPYYYAKPAAGGSANLIANPGFEAFTGTQDDGSGATGTDAFTSWSTAGLNGYADSSTTAHTGSSAVKLHRVDTNTIVIYQNIIVTPSTLYSISFWTRGDGTNAVTYGIYDNTHSAYIQAQTSSGVTGTSYAQKSDSFTTPAGCVSVEISFVMPADGGDGWVDDVDVHAQ